MITEIKRIKEESIQKYLELEQERKRRERELDAYKKYTSSPKKVFNLPKRLLRYNQYVEYQNNYQKYQEIYQQYQQWYDQTYRPVCENIPYNNIQEAQEALETLKKGQTLDSIHFNYDTACEFLEKHHQDIFIEKGELEKGWTRKKKINPNYDEDDAITSYILVHLTDYPPTENQIKTMKDKGAKHQIHTKYLDYEIAAVRPTTHLCVNHEVSDTGVSSWDGKKYAIFVPMTEMLHQKVLSACEADVQVEGSVSLDEYCYCLCPKGEEEKIKKDNPLLHVVPYQAKNVRGIANEFLVGALGYKYIIGNEWGFDERDQKLYQSVMKAHGFSNFDSHCVSDQKKQEELLQMVYQLNAIQNGAMNHQLDLSTSDKMHAFETDIFKMFSAIVRQEADIIEILESSDKEQIEKLLGSTVKEKIEDYKKQRLEASWREKESKKICTKLIAINKHEKHNENSPVKKIQQEGLKNASQLVEEVSQKSQSSEPKHL